MILTLLVNAYLARRADTARREAERRALLISVRTELEILRDTIVHNVEQLEKDADKTGVMSVPLSDMTRIFDASIGKIGLLPEQALKPTITAYLTYKDWPFFLEVAGGKPSTTGRRIFVSRKDVLLSMSKQMLQHIDNALSTLK